MAIQTIVDAFVSVNGVDLSDHVRSVSIDYTADLQEATAMGDLFKVSLGGLKSWSMSVEFNQDYATGEVDATLFPLMGTSTAVIVRQSSAVVGVTNPQLSGNVLLSSYPPIGGSVGDLLTVSASFTGSGTLTRATA